MNRKLEVGGKKHFLKTILVYNIVLLTYWKYVNNIAGSFESHKRKTSFFRNFIHPFTWVKNSKAKKWKKTKRWIFLLLWSKEFLATELHKNLQQKCANLQDNQNSQDLKVNSSGIGIDILVSVRSYYPDNKKYKWESQNWNPSYI